MASSFTQFSFLILLFLLVSVDNCWLSNAEMVPGLYVFGDSLVDVGNNDHIKLSLLKADFPHNGVDYPGQKATGRFSNGLNSADFLAQKLGLPTSPPYLSLSSVSSKNSAILKGVSFASGGAGVLDGTARIFGQCLPMNKQIEYYSTLYGNIVEQMGSNEAQKHLSSSLFAVVIGSNDILGYFKSNSKLRSNYTPQQYIDLLILTLKGQLQKIYNLGARKFVMVGTGAIGCSPSQRLQNSTGDCNVETNYWSLKYSEASYTLLQGMKSEFSDLNYAFLNIYKVVLDYIQNPTVYGFKEVKAACCGLGRLKAEVPCLPIASYCSNRTDHLFWDLYHPTEIAARMFVDKLFDGAQPYVYPVNVKQLIAI